MDEQIILAIVSILTVALLGAFSAWQVRKSGGEAFAVFARELVNGFISNDVIIEQLTDNASHLPEAVNKTLRSLADVLDPFTDATATDLDNDVLDVLKQVLDNARNTKDDGIPTDVASTIGEGLRRGLANHATRDK